VDPLRLRGERRLNVPFPMGKVSWEAHLFFGNVINFSVKVVSFEAYRKPKSKLYDGIFNSTE